MNKVDLIRKIADQADIAKSDVEKVVNSFISTVIENVKGGEKIAIAGLGSFERVIRAARVGINPSTKEQIKIPEKGVPKFKPAKSFKDEVA